MKTNHIAFVACLALTAAAPASAQQYSFTDSVLLAANPCFNASGNQSPEGVVDICVSSEEDLRKLMLAKEAPDATDLAVYRAMMSIVVITIGAAQAEDAGYRSEVSCHTMERAWVFASNIAPPASAAHAADMMQARSDTAKLVRTCRNQYGAPASAPPLD
ncbi:MAG: hypothetical protein ABMA14_00255 [Hyphomonadaceae bacterium]